MRKLGQPVADDPILDMFRSLSRTYERARLKESAYQMVNQAACCGRPYDPRMLARLENEHIRARDQYHLALFRAGVWDEACMRAVYGKDWRGQLGFSGDSE